MGILAYSQNAYAVTVYPGTIIGNNNTNYTADVSPNFNTTSIVVTPIHIYLGGTSYDLNSTTGQVNANITKYNDGINMTLHLTSSFGNVHLFVSGQVQQVKFGTINQPYGTTWQYVQVNTNTDITVGANHDVFISFIPNGFFPFVTDLHYSTLTNSAIDLVWSTPTLGTLSFQGYQINYTTPFGDPQTIIVNNTHTGSTSYTVTGLSNNTQYSFRIGTYASGANYVSLANVLNVQTLTGGAPSLTPGNLNINVGTNPNRFPFAFYRQDTGPTTTDLFVSYPISFNTTCNFNYEFENKNQTFYNLANTPNGTNRVKSLFQFSGVGNDLVNIICRDIFTNETGHYALTQGIDNIPIIKLIHQFENGAFGTAGQFGAFDLIELLVIILSMIALNRVNEAVGTIIMVIVLAALAFFHVGSFPVIIFSAIAMVLLLAVTTTKKLAVSP